MYDNKQQHLENTLKIQCWSCTWNWFIMCWDRTLSSDFFLNCAFPIDNLRGSWSGAPEIIDHRNWDHQRCTKSHASTSIVTNHINQNGCLVYRYGELHQTNLLLISRQTRPHSPIWVFASIVVCIGTDAAENESKRGEHDKVPRKLSQSAEVLVEYMYVEPDLGPLGQVTWRR